MSFLVWITWVLAEHMAPVFSDPFEILSSLAILNIIKIKLTSIVETVSKRDVYETH